MKKLIKSFQFASNGIVQLIRSERNVKIHLLAAVFAILVSAYLNITPVEWCLIIVSIGFVFISEAINTVIEKTLDYINTEHDPKIGLIKDIAAGAVLIASIIAVSIFCFVVYNNLSN